MKSLEIVRVGTCGGLQENTLLELTSQVKSIGFDGLLNFYEGRNEVCDLDLEKDFTRHMKWNPLLCAPTSLMPTPNCLTALQVRTWFAVLLFLVEVSLDLRVEVSFALWLTPSRITKWKHTNIKVCTLPITKWKAAVSGLARLLGHKAVTCCMVIANRRTGDSNADYKNSMDNLIKTVLERI